MIPALLFLFGLTLAPGGTFSQTAWGGETPAPVVSVTASAEIIKAPELIRITIRQYGKGVDAEAAKSALLVAEKKLIKTLTDMGAEVVVATAGASMSSQFRSRFQQDVQMMLRQRGGGNVPADDKTQIPHILERYVQVDLRPKHKNKEVLSLALEIQESFRKEMTGLTGLAAVVADEQVSENLRNEVSAARGYNYGGNPNELRISLAARITKKERRQLLQEAFQRAKAAAGELAEAAESALGGLQSVSSSFTGGDRSFGYEQPGQTVLMDSGNLLRRTLFEDDPETAASLIRPFTYSRTGTYDPLAYQVGISVTYRLTPKK